jgi:hypothetical protein
MRDERNPGGERQDSNGMPASAGASVSAERHYTVGEIAEMLNLSEDAVRRLFCNEPGVLSFGKPRLGSKRRYTTLRIPESVLDRVRLRYTIR